MSNINSSIQQFDLHGIIIPEEFTDALKLRLGDQVYLALDNLNSRPSIVIQKYSPKSKLEILAETYAKVLFSTTNEPIIICDTRKVLASCPSLDLKDVSIPDMLSEAIQVTTIPTSRYYGDIGTFIVGDKEIGVIYPIVKNSHVVGAVLTTWCHPIDENTDGAIRAIVNAIQAQL